MRKGRHKGLWALICFVLLLAGGVLMVTSTRPAAQDEGTGLFTSVGPAKNGKTYYIDAKNGDDTANGTSAQTAWRSLKRANDHTFQPGDHLLLNADSVWNDSYLWPKGNGTKEKPIVIDLYQRDSAGAVTYAANKRPVINGNGTKSVGTFERAISAPVMLRNQENWTISNLEVTNSEDLNNKDAYKKSGTTQRAGILIYGDRQDYTFKNFKVQNNYVHDVQSEYYLNFTDKRAKATGGIIVYTAGFNENGDSVAPGGGNSNTSFADVLIEHNAIQRVGLEGIRTNAAFKTLTDIQIKNNYLEEIAGDGIVLSQVANGGLVEGNVVVRPCNADYGNQNYAGVWAISSSDSLFQYNEVYGIRHGYNDAEAFDIDMATENITFQYNYSHDNAGGFILTMGDQRNSVIRYNISANDGFGNKGTSADNPGKAGAYTYAQQSIMHYWQKAENSTMPLVYNNTFYVGDGITTSLFGEGNSTPNDGVTSRFTNNILVKEGAGKLTFLSNYPPNGTPAIERSLGGDLTKLFTNNVFYPASIATAKSGLTPDVMAAGNNVLGDPKLAISGNPALQQTLKDQSQTLFDPRKDDITEFTGKEKLRARTAIFKPQTDSPALGLGLNKGVDQDFFGTALADKLLDAGFAQVSTTTKQTVYANQNLSLLTATGVYPKLPRELSFTYNELVNGQVVGSGTQDATINWEAIPSADVQKAGTVTVVGHPVGLKGDGAKVTATVTFVGELGDGLGATEVVADRVAFVQKSDGNTAYSAVAGQVGTFAAKDAYKFPFGVNYTGNWSAKLKNAAAAAYNRRIYVSVPSQELNGVIKDASLDLTIMRYDAWAAASGATDQEKLANTQYRIAVYAADNNWQSNTVTWNNAPGNAALGDPIAVRDVQNKDVIANGNVLSINVTDYLLSLKKAGTLPTNLSFIVTITDSNLPNYNADNSGFDIFTVAGAQQAFADYQAGKLVVPAGTTVTATTFAPKLSISNVYEKSVDGVQVSTQAGIAPQLPGATVVHYSDGTDKTVTVTWQDIDPAQYAQAGTFTVLGTAEGVDTPVVATVKVNAPKQVTAFAELPAVDRYVGHSRSDLNLPTTIEATLDDGSTVTFQILSWDDDPNNYSETSPAGTYRFPATLADIAGVTIPAGMKPSQTVHTHAVPKTIELPTLPAIEQGKTASVKPVVKDAAGEVVDAWSSAVTYTVTANNGASTGTLPTIATDGTITVPEGTPVGDYTLTVTSQREPGVSATTSITVIAKTVTPDPENPTDKPDQPGTENPGDKPDKPGTGLPDTEQPVVKPGGGNRPGGSTSDSASGATNSQNQGKADRLSDTQAAANQQSSRKGTYPQTGEQVATELVALGLVILASLALLQVRKRNN